MNTICITGIIGREPEFLSFESRALLTKFTLGVKRYDYKAKTNVTDWFNVETFNKLGEYLAKGQRLCVAGQIITNTYINKDGKNVKNYIVQASEIEILTKKQQEVENTGNEEFDAF